MADLSISAYDAAVEVAMGYPVQQETVAIGAVSAQSAAFSAGNLGIKRVRVCSLNQDCYIDLGSSPTASTSTEPLPKGVVEVKWLKQGDKIAVIAA